MRVVMMATLGVETVMRVMMMATLVVETAMRVVIMATLGVETAMRVVMMGTLALVVKTHCDRFKFWAPWGNYQINVDLESK